jgi:hypothetical protein
MALESSIFNTIKALLGPDADYDVFDHDIIIFINSAISTLTQLGIGPASGFRITGPDETWEQLLGDYKDLESVKTYIYMKVKLAFDPPANSTVLGAYNIKIVKDNEEYQPVNYFQAVNVSITSPEQFLDNLLNNPIKIIHIKEDEEKNEIVFEKILLANKTEDTVECRTNEYST